MYGFYINQLFKCIIKSKKVMQLCQSTDTCCHFILASPFQSHVHVDNLSSPPIKEEITSNLSCFHTTLCPVSTQGLIIELSPSESSPS